MTTRKLTATQTVLSLFSVILAALACIGTIAFPEIREFLGFRKEALVTPAPVVPSEQGAGQMTLPESTIEPSVTSDIATATSGTSTPKASSQKVKLGSSVRGRDIFATQTGYLSSNGPAIVVVGRIAGDQWDTGEVVADVSRQFESDPTRVTNDAILYFVETLNLDGSGNRLNANGVDLNRNWKSFNWTPDPPIVGVITAGAGGASAFSEPETRALRDLLLTLKASGRATIAVVLHSSARSNRSDVYPGYRGPITDSASESHAKNAATVLGFRYAASSTDLTTGELIAWCAENGISAIDILWSRTDGNRPSTQRMVEVINVLSR